MVKLHNFLFLPNPVSIGCSAILHRRYIEGSIFENAVQHKIFRYWHDGSNRKSTAHRQMGHEHDFGGAFGKINSANQQASTELWVSSLLSSSPISYANFRPFQSSTCFWMKKTASFKRASSPSWISCKPVEVQMLFRWFLMLSRLTRSCSFARRACRTKSAVRRWRIS